MSMFMTLYGGRRLETSMPVEVEPIGCGVGRITCPECRGRPAEYAALFPPEVGITQCVECKGTGYVYVNT